MKIEVGQRNAISLLKSSFFAKPIRDFISYYFALILALKKDQIV